MKGSNESSSFPLSLYFPIQLFAACASSALFPLSICCTPLLFCFFLFRTVHLASLPFLSPGRVPPALLRSAGFVTSAVHICCLSLALPCSYSFVSGSCEPARAANKQKTIPPWPLLAPLRSMEDPRAAPLAQLIGGAARPALQLLSNWALLLCRRDGWQGSHFHTSWPEPGLSSQPS